MKFSKTVSALAASLLLSVGAANAASYSLTGLQAGPLKNPGSFTATLTSTFADAVASLDFVIQGYRSLDGNNTYKDVLTLTINGTQVTSGSFNLGGGGTSDTTFGTASAVTVNENGVNPGTVIGWNGGTTTITGLKFNLNQGVNTFKFAYSAPGAANGANGQSGPANLNSAPSSYDEAWGIKSASVTAVPEPETYAMMLAGLGLMGAIARRRQSKRA